MTEVINTYSAPRDGAGHPALLVVNPVSGVLEPFDGIGFKITDKDDAADPSYFGFVDKNGNWYILKVTESAGTYRYCTGTTGYTTAWTGRASLTYAYIYTAF